MTLLRTFFFAASLLLCLSIPARAELSQQGSLIVSFDGGLAPKKLPRKKPVPVAVRVAGGVRVTKGARLPQLRTISVAINRAGKLFDKGLPTCRVNSIQPATEAAARSMCARSIVGTGHVTLRVRLSSQEPFAIKGSLLAFNGPRKHGRKLILAQVYTTDPPGAFVLTFTVKRRGGLFGTVMSTKLPKSALGWAFMTHFEMTLDRRYRWRGKARSYVSAACSAPAGFPGAVFPLAKATYGFDNGKRVSTTILRTCKVAGP